MTNDILNNLFEQPYPIVKRKVGRPKRERRPVGRPSGSKNKNKQNQYYIHIILYIYSINILNIIFINR